MIECRLTNGNIFYIPIERVVRIDQPDDGNGMIIFFINGNGELDNTRIGEFQAIKPGVAYS